MNKENVKLNEDFKQVCVWPACIVGEEKIEDFKKFMLEQFDTRIQYLEEINTLPDKRFGEDVPETGGRNDVFFSIHNEDVGKFAVPRLGYGIRWIEDVLSNYNYESPIYPKRVFEYKSWDTD